MTPDQRKGMALCTLEDSLQMGTWVRGDMSCTTANLVPGLPRRNPRRKPAGSVQCGNGEDAEGGSRNPQRDPP